MELEKRGRVISLVLITIAAALVIAGCGTSSGSSGIAARATSGAVASALASNPYAKADKAQLESELTANFKKEFKPAHPARSVMAAIRDTFPQGDTGKIASYAVAQFTPAVGAPGQSGKAARAAWAQKVVEFAITSGGPTLGTPSIPGVSVSGPSSPGATP